MLKVVGATWTSSRVFSLVIGGIIVIVLVLIIIWELDRYEEDGNYAATVFWSERIGYHIKFWGEGNKLDDLPRGVARAVFHPDNQKTGWSQLEVQSQAGFDDSVQAYAAGYLEGCLSWQLIYQHWANTVQPACVGRRQEFCQRVRHFLRNNTDAVREMAADRELDDPYWHQVNLFYKQLDGIINGWQYGMFRSQSDRFDNIPAEDFLWMNVVSDLADLELMFGGTYQETGSPLAVSGAVGLSSAFVKLNSDTEELFLAHNSAGLYSSMLKMLKRYELPYHRTASEDADVVTGTSLTFSSYPGAVHSQDDLYHVAGNRKHALLVAGSAMLVTNRALWAKVVAREQVLMGPRVLAANRLARDGRSWSHVAGRGNGGTGNKQWLVVDPSRLRHLGQKGLLTVAEQLPGRFHTSDRSHMLWSRDHFAVHGLPFHHDIQVESGALAAESSLATESPASLIFRRDQERAVDALSIQRLMRSNDFAGDPLSKGDPLLAIAPRGDIASVAKSVASHVVQPLGVTDFKMIRCADNGDQCQVHAIAGPTFHVKPDKSRAFKRKLVPFKWSSSIFSMLPHLGQPDEWNFGLVRPSWAWD